MVGGDWRGIVFLGGRGPSQMCEQDGLDGMNMLLYIGQTMLTKLRLTRKREGVMKKKVYYKESLNESLIALSLVGIVVVSFISFFMDGSGYKLFLTTSDTINYSLYHLEKIVVHSIAVVIIIIFIIWGLALEFKIDEVYYIDVPRKVDKLLIAGDCDYMKIIEDYDIDAYPITRVCIAGRRYMDVAHDSLLECLGGGKEFFLDISEGGQIIELNRASILGSREMRLRKFTFIINVIGSPAPEHACKNYLKTVKLENDTEIYGGILW